MKRLPCILLMCALSFGVCVVSGKQLPSFVKKCKLDSSQLNDCMKNAIMDFKRYLEKGVDELKLPSMNPYVLPQAYIETSWMNGTLTNLKLYNAHDYYLNYFNIDLNRAKIEMNLTIPYMEMKSHYEVDGRILQFIMHGEGEMEGKINDTNARIVLSGNKIHRNGQEYLDLTDIDYKLLGEPKSYTYFHDLFRNNPDITERVNQVIQENQDSLYKDIYPIVEKIVSAIDLSLFKGVFHTYSLKELFD